MYCITYFHFYKSCVNITTNRAVNYFKYSDVLPPYWFLSQPVHSLVKESECKFDNSGTPISSVKVIRLSPNLQLHLSGYLLPPTGLQTLLNHHMRVLFVSTKSYMNQLEFEPLTLRSSNYQAEYHWSNSSLTLFRKCL